MMMRMVGRLRLSSIMWLNGCHKLAASPRPTRHPPRSTRHTTNTIHISSTANPRYSKVKITFVVHICTACSQLYGWMLCYTKFSRRDQATVGTRSVEVADKQLKPLRRCCLFIVVLPYIFCWPAGKLPPGWDSKSKSLKKISKIWSNFDTNCPSWDRSWQDQFWHA